MGTDGRSGWFAALALASLLVGCDRRVEPYVSQHDEPPAPDRPVRMPGLERPMPSDLASRLESSVGSQLRAGSDSSAAGAPIRGKVLLPDGESAQGRTLFAIARTAGGGPPLAVRRMSGVQFPAEFEIGPQDMMLPGRAFAGPLFVTLRLDRDGNASTRAADDLAATVDHPVQPGDSGIEVTLVPEGAHPGERLGPPAAPAGDAAASIEGTLRASDDVVVPPGAVLFLIARSTSGGPPLAVRKLEAGPFPMAFRIGAEDTMIAGRPFHGPVKLSARIDEDGDAISRGSRDSAGEAPAPVEPGAAGVEILLRPAPSR
jgi:hypothetical protein